MTVGCEGVDGLLRVHDRRQVCEVCKVVRHHKGGVYEVITYGARIEREGVQGEEMAVYRNVDTGAVWVRPAREFEELVPGEGGGIVPRFEVIPPPQLIEKGGA